MELNEEPSLIIPYGSHSLGKCGYCKRPADESKRTWGMHAVRLNPSDYQHLIDRGWRRSGDYCYKPLNRETCCPSYTIRCDATKHCLTKSQKKCHSDNVSIGFDTSTKELCKYELNCGDIPLSSFANPVVPMSSNCLSNLTCESNLENMSCAGDTKSKELNRFPKKHDKVRCRRWAAKQKRLYERSIKEKISYDVLLKHLVDCASNEFGRSKCAALEYFERREKRLAKNFPKCIEDFIDQESKKCEGQHYIEIRLLSTSCITDEFNNSLNESHQLYKKYQMSVHRSEESECEMEQFKSFLVTTPLVYKENESNAPAFGSYHQQYWLDGTKLIAVAVIDILPKCISSVYVYYDPDYAFLYLGVYTALREIYFIRQLYRMYTSNISTTCLDTYKDFYFYYMGYFIKSCPKMSYKAQYKPAYLACPESYSWCPIEHCLTVLANGTYGRFSSPSIQDPFSIPGLLSDALLDSNIFLCISPMKNGNHDGKGGKLLALGKLVHCLNKRAASIFREWARLIGKRVLSGRMQILLNINE